jgi:hypothetical protein
MSNSNNNIIIKCIGNICKIKLCKESIKLTNNKIMQRHKTKISKYLQTFIMNKIIHTRAEQKKYDLL